MDHYNTAPWPVLPAPQPFVLPSGLRNPSEPSGPGVYQKFPALLTPMNPVPRISHTQSASTSIEDHVQNLRDDSNMYCEHIPVGPGDGPIVSPEDFEPESPYPKSCNEISTNEIESSVTDDEIQQFVNVDPDKRKKKFLGTKEFHRIPHVSNAQSGGDGDSKYHKSLASIISWMFGQAIVCSGQGGSKLEIFFSIAINLLEMSSVGSNKFAQ